MGNNFDPDYLAGKDGATHYLPVDRAEYDRGVAEREGRAGRTANWGNGGAGFPVFFLAFIPILLAAGYVVAVPLYPVAGIITLVLAYVFSLIVGVDLYSDQGIGNLVVTVLICIPIYLVGLIPENRAARNPRYRTIRHWVRVVGLGLALNEVILPTLAMWVTGGDSREYVRWGLLAGGFSLGKLVCLVASMALVHVFFRWWKTRGLVMSIGQRYGLRRPV
ncbi:hypothetical protein V5F72_01290 [Xanthobacter flavus]|uniref:hypothetical protein n=1 Tax=Xanthobacter flavus TaxID=281 RepID=UPI00372A365E